MSATKGVGSPVAKATTWDDVSGKPNSFPPSAHQHNQGDVQGLVAALALLASKQELTDRINAILNGAPAALDTLKEIADRFALEDSEQAGILAAIADRLRLDAPGSYTTQQQAQGRSNLGIDLAALSTQRAILTYSGADITWTYPTPFASGAAPIIEALAVGPATGNNASALFNVQLVGDPTNTSAKFRVNTIAAASVSLLGLINLNLFSQAPTGVKLHVTARAP